MKASPSPSPVALISRHRRLLLMAGGPTLAMLALVFGWLYPYWADGLVARKIVERLEQRTQLEVALVDFDLGYERVEIGRVVVRGEGIDIVVDAVDVGYDRAQLYSGRLGLEDIVLERVTVQATRNGLETVLRRLRGERGSGDAGKGPAERPSGGGRLGLPSRVEVRGFSVDVKGAAGGQFERMRTGGRAIVARGEDNVRSAEIWFEDTELTGLGGRVFSAAKLHTRALQAQPDAAVGQKLQFPLKIGIEGGATRLSPNLAVAGVQGTFTIEDAQAAELSVALKGGFSGGESGVESEVWSISGRARRDLSAGKVVLDMESFELGRLPKLLARLPLVESERATVGGHLEVDFALGVAEVEGKLGIAGLNVSHSLLAQDVVRGVGFDLTLAAQLDPRARTVEIAKASLQVGEIAVLLSGTMVHPPVREQRKYSLRIEVPSMPCQALLDSIPQALIPGLQGFALRGQYMFDGALEADFSNLDAMILDGLTRGLGMDKCRVRTAPRRAQPKRLLGPLTHRVTLRDGSTKTVHLALGSGQYTPLTEIAPEVAAAVLTTEDGGFWRHGGFILSQIKAALRRNLSAGQVQLGASTITMQMVKNLLLSHERTLSRKIQEVFATWYVERVLPKERIMELYLNVIEFGPGVYGITRAADHYFGKLPGDLNSLEAAFLAMMLPSPVRRHEVYCNGKLDKLYDAKVRRIHGFMYSRDRIDEDSYLMWKDAELVFDLEERGRPQECLEEISRLLEGEVGQRALTGLLGEGDAGRAPVSVRGDAGRRHAYIWGEARLPGERFHRYRQRVGIEEPSEE